ncbi:Siroheme synthase [Raoultella planticola]|uniref:Siroheme synthase n=1 Tax=Raoultella planticola TaxID=575 RepID=A0A485CLQ3_RAOPL|nr:Siroheme synthase [Raoultella planticola]
MPASCVSRVKKQFATVGERRRFWEKLFVNDRLAQSLANEDRQAVADTTEQLLTEPLDHRGEVVLVGAGPGGCRAADPQKGSSRFSRRTSWCMTVWFLTTL